MGSPVNARDPRVKRTRELLQGAFAELVREKSFDALTVGDIAARATLNRATFYAHFADKYALLDATIAASFAWRLQGHIPAEASMTEAAVRALIVAVCDYYRALSTQCTALISRARRSMKLSTFISAPSSHSRLSVRCR